MFEGKDVFFLFNHIDIVIMYHQTPEGARLVKATLQPKRYALQVISFFLFAILLTVLS